MGKNRATIANTLRLLDLPKEIRMALSENKISESHAKVILSLETPEEQLNFFQKILENRLSVREAESQVKKIKGRKIYQRIKLSPELKEKEDRLREFLGTKVMISKKGRQGKIIIDFYSEEELNGIIDKIFNR